jgi:hypothetical protein
MRKVDGLSLTVIDIYVPAFTYLLNSTDTSLKLSENITLFGVCRIHVYTGVIIKEAYIDTRCLGRIIYIVMYFGMCDYRRGMD